MFPDLLWRVPHQRVDDGEVGDELVAITGVFHWREVADRDLDARRVELLWVKEIGATRGIDVFGCSRSFRDS